MEAKKVDIKEMSQVTGISAKEIKLALGMPLNFGCTANTIAEAQEAYNNPETPEAKIAAIEKWIDLCTTADEANTAHFYAPDNSDSKILAKRRWDELSWSEIKKTTTSAEAEVACRTSSQKIVAIRNWIDLCSTTAEMRKAYNYYSAGNLPENSQEIAIIILEKWDIFSLQEIKNATSAEESRSAFKNASHRTKKAYDAALKKWIGLSETTREVEEIYWECGDDSVWKPVIIKKWIELSLLKIDSLTNAAEAETAFYTAGQIHSSEVKNSILKKWIELSSSVSEISKAYRAANHPDDEVNAREKWNILSLLEVELATTAVEAKRAYNNAPNESESEAIALKKWNELSLEEAESITTATEAKNSFYNAPEDSGAKATALQNWIKLSDNVAEAQQAYNACTSSEDKTAALEKIASFFTI